MPLPLGELRICSAPGRQAASRTARPARGRRQYRLARNAEAWASRSRRRRADDAIGRPGPRLRRPRHGCIRWPLERLPRDWDRSKRQSRPAGRSAAARRAVGRQSRSQSAQVESDPSCFVERVELCVGRATGLAERPRPGGAASCRNDERPSSRLSSINVRHGRASAGPSHRVGRGLL